jgi:hypothetical protein
MKYKYDTLKIINNLKSKGYSFLPSIQQQVDNLETYNKFSNEELSKTYSTNSSAHLELVNFLKLDTLFTELYERAYEFTNKKIDINDKYFVSRFVSPGQTSEGYRGHFDSHLFTIVLPIRIPNDTKIDDRGQLIVFPKARKEPSLDVVNIFQKTVWKRYSNKHGFKKLSKKKHSFENDFTDYRPLIFIGNTTFHGNKPLQNLGEARLSMLCHLYDTGGKAGIGSIIRKIRAR